MTKTTSKTRALSLLLAVLMLLGVFPMNASAATIADGSSTATIGMVDRNYYLSTTAGTKLGASAYADVLRNVKDGSLLEELDDFNTEVWLKRAVKNSVAFTEAESLHEAISCGFDLEAIAIDRVLMEELETALKSWKPWANELLKLYLEGKGRSCTISLSEKYHITDRAIQKRKTAFEKFVVVFLKK